MPGQSLPTEIVRAQMTGEQLTGSPRVAANTRFGRVVGGRVRNGCQVFLNVPYGLPVERFADPEPLPEGYRYSGEFRTDGLYAAQPRRSYTQQIPIRDRLGLGQPTENPFFADIYVPSDYELAPLEGREAATASTASTPANSTPTPTPNTPSTHSQPTAHAHPARLRPVRVFIHGGFLQFGSTSGDSYNQQFFAAEHFGEVRVLLGHRVSVFGFLASETPFVSGNFGFKDCWLGLQWVRENIASFGGDPDQIHLSGLSGGAHVVHQLLHYAARRAPERAPFVTALLQSNAILAPPLTRRERADQFAALCAELGVDPASPAALEQLRDTASHPTEKLIAAVERMGSLCTFRGVASDDGWVAPDQMAYQRTRIGRDLLAAGVKCVIAGDVRDEDHFYAGCHDVPSAADLAPNVARYYPDSLAASLLAAYPPLSACAPREECQTRLGRVLADGQVHLPVRLLCADLAPLPTVRYTIELVAAALGTGGKATHGSDLAIQHVRFSVLSEDEAEAALQWHKELRAAVEPALSPGGGFVQRPPEQVLALAVSGKTEWVHDARWAALRAAEAAVRPK